MTEHTICFNAFDADGSYTSDPAEIVGWSIYARLADDPDTSVGETFEAETREEADTIVARLAAHYNTTDIREF